jgi:hypothetical protein
MRDIRNTTKIIPINHVYMECDRCCTRVYWGEEDEMYASLPPPPLALYGWTSLRPFDPQTKAKPKDFCSECSEKINAFLKYGA